MTETRTSEREERPKWPSGEGQFGLFLSDRAIRWIREHGQERECLHRFFARMVEELAANDGKGNRPGWLSMNRKEAMGEIGWHLAKLQVAAKAFEADDAPAGLVLEYAADVANCSLDGSEMWAPEPERPDIQSHTQIGRGEGLRWVGQVDAEGCGVAVLAMLTGEPYEALRDQIDSEQRVYANMVDEWPPPPWSPLHFAQVTQPSNRSHFVAMDDRGRVLDPLREGTFALSDWSKVQNVVGLFNPRWDR